MIRNPETAYLVSNEEFDKNWMPSVGHLPIWSRCQECTSKRNVRTEKIIRDWFRELLEVLFQAAALVIDSIRTFFLIVLSILYPLSFAISVWDGFQHTLTQWLSRYISVYLWLPVADLFSAMLAKIQALIIERDIELLNDPSYIPDTNNTVYSIYMIIGIVGYLTIPTVAGWIIQVGGGNNMLKKSMTWRPRQAM